jgi:BirA family transcriptional regulator, biotin operon repressor / biotin---[acetyl-CoA-carboxylase] ligase
VSFDQHLFQRHLNTQTFGHPLHWIEATPSTNTYLWNLVHQGAAPGTAVIAAQQQSGRGQHGRTWLSAPGGLYLSVILLDHRSHIQGDQLPQLTVCSAWGVAQGLRDLDIPVSLKWPNDLLLQGKKLGGILSETTMQGHTITSAIVGIGINWCNCVPETGIALQSAFNVPPPISSLEALAAVTLKGLETGYQRWRQDGIEALLPDYLSLVTAWQAEPATMRLSNTLVLSLNTLRSQHSRQP